MATVQPQTIINQDVTPQERPRLTAAEVDAQWRQNLGGGIGASIIVFVLVGGAWLVVGVSAWPQAAAITVCVALAAGALVFGGLMLFRSFVDELMDWQAYRDMCADIEAYETDLQAAEQEIVRLKARVRELAGELAGAQEMARGKNFTPAEPGTTGPLAEDVREMIRVRYAIGEHPSRRYMKETLEWSQPRHERAMSELRRAKIITGDSQNPAWPETMSDAIDLLAKAV